MAKRRMAAKQQGNQEKAQREQERKAADQRAARLRSRQKVPMKEASRKKVPMKKADEEKKADDEKYDDDDDDKEEPEGGPDADETESDPEEEEEEKRKPGDPRADNREDTDPLGEDQLPQVYNDDGGANDNRNKFGWLTHRVGRQRDSFRRRRKLMMNKAFRVNHALVNRMLQKPLVVAAVRNSGLSKDLCPQRSRRWFYQTGVLVGRKNVGRPGSQTRNRAVFRWLEPSCNASKRRNFKYRGVGTGLRPIRLPWSEVPYTITADGFEKARYRRTPEDPIDPADWEPLSLYNGWDINAAPSRAQEKAMTEANRAAALAAGQRTAEQREAARARRKGPRAPRVGPREARDRRGQKIGDPRVRGALWKPVVPDGLGPVGPDPATRARIAREKRDRNAKKAEARARADRVFGRVGSPVASRTRKQRETGRGARSRNARKLAARG